MTTSTRIVRWHGVAAVELRAPDTTAIVVPELGMLVASFVILLGINALQRRRGRK